ncbi:phosphoglucosamine mutase [bacterium BMS3Abin07]|nr:phosphoglucosamine mutase [bacterium BMS3Abin07]GBE32350.1 phosphoglucosamine mutase [bacterium BMS3Bbin05]HDL20777.1 phosphoglucosamine mutase [Nitrospirota bacterium]HDO21711.1 phosphoglucosamine mutase [Nitrospirota bacterium]HDZ87652.1 phosphoglucosamine mutase [Nitrospirota bacterium]
MKLFGTDGIRGKVNSEAMRPETVLRVGMAAAKVLKKKHGRNLVLIGKDTRLSGYMIESALTSGICSMGMNVILVGPVPTPGVAYLTRALRLDAGIVISASHNPFQDNGIKFFSHDGFKLPEALESEIEVLVHSEGGLMERPQGAGIGKAVRLDDATGRCIEYIKSTIPRGVDFEGLKIVVDCANGAAYKITPWVFRELGAEVIAINDKPNGININDNCGSLYMDRLREEVVSAGADVGIAHDGDADRTLFCDEKGDIVDGDKAMGLLAVGLKETGHLMNDTLVSTVMSNLGLEHYLQSRGIKLVRTSVGDRYVVEKMREGGYNFGGEQSGHIVFFDHNTTGDGPITAIQMMHLLKKRRKFSDLAGEIKMYPQILENVAVGKRRSIDSIPAVTQAVEKVRRDLEGRGRILVRPSGTEPKIRIMVEGDDQRLIKECAEYISKIIADSLS